MAIYYSNADVVRENRRRFGPRVLTPEIYGTVSATGESGIIQEGGSGGGLEGTYNWPIFFSTVEEQLLDGGYGTEETNFLNENGCYMPPPPSAPSNSPFCVEGCIDGFTPDGQECQQQNYVGYGGDNLPCSSLRQGTDEISGLRAGVGGLRYSTGVW
jgi:hypothetical protein